MLPLGNRLVTDSGVGHFRKLIEFDLASGDNLSTSMLVAIGFNGANNLKGGRHSPIDSRLEYDR
jgi:hypothetical protein